MLHEFLVSNRAELIRRCRAKVAARRAPHEVPPDLGHGVPVLLDQLAGRLALRARPAGPPITADSRMDDAASHRGGELRLQGYTIEQVVHEYGDLCQAITELADERGAPVTAHEFGTLSIHLDNAIAHAVGEFARPGSVRAMGEGPHESDGRLEVLASDMRDALDHTIRAFDAIKAASGGAEGDAVANLERSLADMRALIDRTFAGCRERR
jgi:hypothetical protein